MRNAGPIRDFQPFLSSGTGPIQSNRWSCLGTTLGPFETFGSISQEWCWAYSRPSAVSSLSNAGPIWDLRQHFLGAVLGPFKAIGRISQEGVLGPLRAISSLVNEKCWAHSRLSAAFLSSGTGPIQGNRWSCLGTRWAHLRPSAAFLRRGAGPIQDHRH